MLSSFSTIPCPPPHPRTLFLSPVSKKHNLFLLPQVLKRSNGYSSMSISCIQLGISEIAEITQNKVLVAATLSAAIGQLAKPFTSALLYGDNINFKASFRAGGFPSVHSTGVMVAATSLGLERGLSDPIFGMSVILAGIIMYDAQGVRREAGNHAKLLNKMLELKKGYSNPYSEDEAKLASLESLASLVPGSEEATDSTTKSFTYSQSAVNSEREKSIIYSSPFPLKESLGHTEIEVVAGAFLGFFITLVVYTVM